MSKSKSKGSKGAAPTQDVLTKVKDAAITKPSQSVKAKSKEIAKQVASKEEKKSKSKKVKEPTPEPSESESEDESDESESSEDSESEREIKKPVKKGKLNGTATVTPKSTKNADSDSDEDDSEDESEVSDESESSEDDVATNGVHNKASIVPKADAQSSDEEESSDESDAGVPAAKAVRTADSSDEEEEDDDDEEEEEDDDDDDDDEDDSDDESDVEEALAKDKGPVKAEELSKKLNPIAANTSSEEDSDEDSDDSVADNDDSEEDSSDDEEEVKPAQPTKAKRKAEEVAAPAAKKSKTAEASADDGQGGNLFVGNLSWNVDEEWLTREFEEFGELSGVRIITDRNTGRSKGFGYVEFVNAGDAAKAHAAKKGALVDNRALNIDFANKKSNEGPQERAQSRAKSFGDKNSPPSDTLFVGNLSFDAGQETVSEAFGEWGTILGVRLPTDRDTGEPKGFGYVTFSSVDEAKAALENMQGAEIGGRACRLDFSQPRPQNGESGGRGGGGFGGRGGGRGGFGGRGGGRGGFGDRGGRGGRGRGGFGDRGGRGGRGGSTNRGGFGDFTGKKVTF